MACAFHAAADSAAAGDLDGLLFGSLDAGRSTFLTAGVKVAFDSVEREGPAALLSLGAGARGERVTCGCGQSVSLTRYTAVASAVFGYQWFFDWGVLAAYAGPEGTWEALAEGLASASPRSLIGLRLHGEAWVRPSDESLLQASAIAGSTRDSLWTRIARGYRFWDTYLGPEASLSVARTGYRKVNVGLHATGFSFAGYTMRVSAGVQTESSAKGVGPYVAFATWTPW